MGIYIVNLIFVLISILELWEIPGVIEFGLALVRTLGLWEIPRVVELGLALVKILVGTPQGY